MDELVWGDVESLKNQWIGLRGNSPLPPDEWILERILDAEDAIRGYFGESTINDRITDGVITKRTVNRAIFNMIARVIDSQYNYSTQSSEQLTSFSKYEARASSIARNVIITSSEVNLLDPLGKANDPIGSIRIHRWRNSCF